MKKAVFAAAVIMSFGAALFAQGAALGQLGEVTGIGAPPAPAGIEKLPLQVVKKWDTSDGQAQLLSEIERTKEKIRKYQDDPAMAGLYQAELSALYLEFGNTYLRAAKSITSPALAVRGVHTVEFFDEWGEGVKQIPWTLEKYGVKVTAAENNDNITSITYEGPADLIKEAKTRGEYGPGDGHKIAREVNRIVKKLEAAGKKIIWAGRWGDMIDGATVYYMD